eukprot:15452707-Alexandrium_andersonii.AAC.1
MPRRRKTIGRSDRRQFWRPALCSRGAAAPRRSLSSGIPAVALRGRPVARDPLLGPRRRGRPRSARHRPRE